MDVTLSLDSLNKLYYAGDSIQGSVLIINKSKTTVKFDLIIKVVGYYTFRNTKENPPKLKAVQFYKKSYNALTDQYSTIGANNSFRFKFPLTSDGSDPSYDSLYESYHGVCVSVGYEIYAEVLSMGKPYPSKKQKLIVLVPGQGINSKFGRKRVTYQFNLNPKKIESIKLTDQN